MLDERPVKRDFALLWVMSPRNCKATFEYVRNTGLCIVVVISAIYMQKMVYERTLFGILTSNEYKYICSIAKDGQYGYLKNSIRRDTKYYFEGFKTNRVTIPLSDKDTTYILKIVGTIEYRKQKQKQYNPAMNTSSTVLIGLSAALVVLNIVSLFTNIQAGVEKVFSGGKLRVFLKLLDRGLLISALIIVTVPLYLSIYSHRSVVFSSEEFGMNEILEYVGMLGANEYEDMSMYATGCNVHFLF